MLSFEFYQGSEKIWRTATSRCWDHFEVLFRLTTHWLINATALRWFIFCTGMFSISSQWSLSRHLIIFAVLCINGSAFFGSNRQVKSRFLFQMHLDSNVNPRSDREMTYDSLHKSTGNILKVSSVLLLSQMSTSISPLKANAAGYQAAPSAFAYL